MVRIFMASQRVRGWDLLDASGLMRVILPEIEAMKGCAQPPQFHPEGDVFTHTRIMLDLLPEGASLPLVLSVLFHDIGKPPSDEERKKYVEAFGKLAESPQAKTVIVPADMAGITGSIAGIGELVKFATGAGPRPTTPPQSSVPRAGA